MLRCFGHDMSIPELPYLQYSAAMHGLTLSISNVSPGEKERLGGLVRSMAGMVCKTFHEGATHLVAGVIGSKKYQAAEAGEVAEWNLLRSARRKPFIEAHTVPDQGDMR